jgi:hypothetical protein
LLQRHGPIFHIALFISHNFSRTYRLESGLVRLARRDTSALSKRRMENYFEMTNVIWKMKNTLTIASATLTEPLRDKPNLPEISQGNRAAKCESGDVLTPPPLS